MFTAALFTIMKNWKQPRCPELTKYDITVEKNMISNKKKWTIDSYNLDISQRHYAEFKKLF